MHEHICDTSCDTLKSVCPHLSAGIASLISSLQYCEGLQLLDISFNWVGPREVQACVDNMRKRMSWRSCGGNGEGSSSRCGASRQNNRGRSSSSWAGASRVKDAAIKTSAPEANDTGHHRSTILTQVMRDTLV
jgi:hypothetical protein